jgi:hypothetical protein
MGHGSSETEYYHRMGPELQTSDSMKPVVPMLSVLIVRSKPSPEG